MIYCFLCKNDHVYRSKQYGSTAYSRIDGKFRSNSKYSHFYEYFVREKGHIDGLDKVQKYNNIHLFINDII